jgi:methyltransferase (TIGR00027 family)
MNIETGSATSLGVAGLRAAHQLIDGEPKLFRDPVIGQLLGARYLEHMRHNTGLYREPRLMHLRSHVVLRSRYAEDRLADAFARGIRQYMLLGAGLDTYAWRQPPGRESLQIFEVDHPATQEKKRVRIMEAGMTLPDNCRFVPVDFESTTLREGLGKSRFDFTIPSFISWLGVTVYLTEEAIDAVLAFVASLPAGTEMVFTFTQKTAYEGPGTSAYLAAKAGEPWITYFTPEELSLKLRKHGFSSAFLLTPEEARQNYFQGRTDGLPVPTRASIARVVV